MSKNTAELDIGSEALISIVAKLMMAIIGFAGIVIFARVLGSAGLGVYYIMLTASRVLAMASFGLGTALEKRVSETDSNPSKLLGGAFLFHTGFTVIIGLGGFLVSPLVPHPYSATSHIFGMTFVFVATGGFALLSRFYSGLGYPGRAVWHDTGRSMFTLAFQLFFIWKGFGPVGLLLGIATATLLSSVLIAIAAGVIPSIPNRYSIKRLASFSKWSIPTAFISTFYTRVDIFLLGAFVSASAVGFYEGADRLVIPGLLLASSISNPLSVKASGRFSEGRSITDDLANVLSYVGLFAIPIFFGALAVGDTLMVTVYGPDFVESGDILVAISAFYLFKVYQNPFASAISGFDRPKLILLVQVMALIVHVPLSIALVPYLGAFGIIGATAFAELLMVITYQYLSINLFEGPFFPRPILSQVCSGFGMYLIVTTAKQSIPSGNLQYFVVLIALGAASYFALLLLISSHFRNTANSILHA